MTASEYWEEIEALAKSIPREARERGDDPSDVLHETIDGHQFVIYTAEAREVLAHSPNDSAIFDEMGEQTVSDWGTIFSQAAYFAMCADVRGHSEWSEDPADDETEDDETEVA